MPFKIVQTSENGQDQLTVCPSGWESHGILYWPKKKIKKLIKNEDSFPKPDWSIMKCVVKRQNIPNHDKAEKELQNMLDCTSSEQEQAASLSLVPVAQHSRQQEMEDFNEIAKQATTASAATMESSETVYLYATDGVYLDTDFAPDLAAVEENISEVIPKSDITEKIAENQNDILANQQQIMNNQKLVIENQKQLMKNHDNMMMAIAEMSVKFDNIITAAKAPLPALSTMNEKSLNNTIFCLKPITNISELCHLENDLQDDQTKAEYIKKYSIVCGPEKALNCAYKLCDVLFSREFLTQCSWSGSTRGEGTKVSIKTYKNVLNLFFSIVHQSDQTYTVAENEKFFKSVLKNSTKRKLSKLQRTSTCRNSHKRQKPMTAEDNALNEADLPKEANALNEAYVINKENLINEANVPIKGNFPYEANAPIEHNMSD